MEKQHPLYILEFFREFDVLPDKSENAYLTGNYGELPEFDDTAVLRLLLLYNSSCEEFDHLIPIEKNLLIMQLCKLLPKYKERLYNQVREVFHIRGN